MVELRRSQVAEGADAASMFLNMLTQAIQGEQQVKSKDVERDMYIRSLEHEAKMNALKSQTERKQYEESTTPGEVANRMLQGAGLVGEFEPTARIKNEYLIGLLGGVKKAKISATGKGAGRSTQTNLSPEAILAVSEFNKANSDYEKSKAEYNKTFSEESRKSMNSASVRYRGAKSKMLELQKAGKYYLTKEESVQPQGLVGGGENQDPLGILK